MKLVMKTLWQLSNKETKYRELKENIGMMKSQKSDTEKNNLIEKSKKIGINEVINNSLRP